MNIILAFERSSNGKYHKGPWNTNFKVHFSEKRGITKKSGKQKYSRNPGCSTLNI